MTTIQKLFERKKREKRSSLAPFFQLMNELGNPERSFRSVHIAGTNGKGSVATKIARGIEESGNKVGLYTSPHLFQVTERIQINQKEIDEEKLTALLEPLMERYPHLTFFDTLTAAAFLYFKEERVDWAVIECGIGGRYDTTNVITPELSVITTIGYDHQEMLGNTLQEIADAKAGIIKPPVPALLGPSISPALFREKHHQASCSSPIYDEENRATAKAALELLGFRASPSALAAKPRGRAEKILYEGVPFLFDVAHNCQGIEALVRLLTPGKKTVIFGCAKEKERHRMLELLSPYTGKLLLIKHPLLDDNLMGLTPSEALTLSLQEGKETLVTGSFHTVQSLYEKLLQKGPVNTMRLILKEE